MASGLHLDSIRIKTSSLEYTFQYGQRVLDADGFAQVFPEHKLLIVEILRQYGSRAA